MKTRILNLVSFLAISGIIISPIAMAISVAAIAILMSAGAISASAAAAIAIQHIATLAVIGGVSLLVAVCADLAKL